MRSVFVLCLFGVMLLAGCGDSKPPIYGAAGKHCSVQYRMNYVENGPSTTVEGILIKTSPEWIVVAAEDGEYVIPIFSIQYLRIDPPKKR